MVFVYILWSETLKRFYVGVTADIKDRILRHNGGRSKFTKAGIPWILVHVEEFSSRTLATRREKEIKSSKSSAMILKLIGERPD